MVTRNSPATGTHGAQPVRSVVQESSDVLLPFRHSVGPYQFVGHLHVSEHPVDFPRAGPLGSFFFFDSFPAASS